LLECQTEVYKDYGSQKSLQDNYFLSHDYKTEIDDVPFYKASIQEQNRILDYIRDEFIKLNQENPHLMKRSMLFSDAELGNLLLIYTSSLNVYNWQAAQHIVTEHAKDIYSTKAVILIDILSQQAREGKLTMYSSLPGQRYMGSSDADSSIKTPVKEDTTKVFQVISAQEISDLLAA
jgi:hypothetical protein